MFNPFPLSSPLSKFSVRSFGAFGNAKTKVYADGTTNTTYCR